MWHCLRTQTHVTKAHNEEAYRRKKEIVWFLISNYFLASLCYGQRCEAVFTLYLLFSALTKQALCFMTNETRKSLPVSNRIKPNRNIVGKLDEKGQGNSSAPLTEKWWFLLSLVSIWSQGSLATQGSQIYDQRWLCRNRNCLVQFASNRCVTSDPCDYMETKPPCTGRSKNWFIFL